jgi:4-hydroxy-tetrahydrodipicolinate synthase
VEIDMSLNGVYTALITPFQPDHSIDWSGLDRLIDFQIDSGVTGILLLGTTAETPTLDAEEQEQILKHSITKIAGRVPVMVGIGTNNTKTTIKNALLAESLGANSLLLVSPYYNKPTQDGLKLHFSTVAQATALPIVLYNIAGRTGVNIQTHTILELSNYKNIIGVKEASGSVEQIAEVIQKVQNQSQHFQVTSGDDALTLPVMALGACGVISVVSNLFPKEVSELVAFAAEGNFEEARKLHYRLLPFFKGAFIETNPAPIKYLMSKKGLPGGPVRLPLAPLSNSARQELEQLSFVI